MNSGITCSRLSGPVDMHGNQYAGPPCVKEACEYCDPRAGKLRVLVAYLSREYPYKKCINDGHEHQMLLCSPCKVLNSHRRYFHWYCPDLGSPHEANAPYNGGKEQDHGVQS